ncbi:hypothetical protein [Salinimicrobium sp. HB62]|uniref:hypothetical protein n=1 Tax=Salinimicrobium sp. HB62 TaxID=3077781 RepID=UPI002D77C6BC|nr:hypothetical protein [Salinimicrobium sp. HB62]
MRKSILLYLFVFTALLAVFFYVNGNKKIQSQEQELETLKEKVNDLEVDAEAAAARNTPEETFTLISNEEALTYLENRGFDPIQVAARVEEELISRNKADVDNDLVPYEGMNGPFRVNKVKLLNHKWAIASFTDGTYWGELLISFELDEAGSPEITTEKAVLYPRN